jgi:hypothetical protein
VRISGSSNHSSLGDEARAIRSISACTRDGLRSLSAANAGVICFSSPSMCRRLASLKASKSGRIDCWYCGPGESTAEGDGGGALASDLTRSDTVLSRRVNSPCETPLASELCTHPGAKLSIAGKRTSSSTLV